MERDKASALRSRHTACGDILKPSGFQASSRHMLSATHCTQRSGCAAMVLSSLAPKKALYGVSISRSTRGLSM